MHRHSGIRPKKGSSSHNEPQHVCRGALNIPSPGCGSPCVRRCEFGARGNGMVLRAQELADWLNTKPFAHCPTSIQLEGKSFHKKIAARKGIVFFKDYWMRDGEKSPTGDHIDLWNMDRLTPSWQSFTRFTLGIGRIPGIYSDLENSRSVVFWPFAG